MKKGTFKSFLSFELKRSLTWRNIIVLVLFLGISMYFVSTGNQQYNDIKETKKEFQNLERLKVLQLQTYDQYGGYGFRLYFMPSVLSVFFNNTNLFNELSAQVDVGPKLNIYDSFRGKQVFSLKPGRWLDFSGIMLIFGSLMALYYGYDAFKRREYLRFFSSLYGHRRVYSFIWLSRMLLLSLYFLFVFFCAILLLKFNGLDLAGGQFVKLLIFLLIMLLMLVFFFTLGTIAATRSKFKVIMFVLIWFGFAYFLPVFINIIIAGKAGDITSNYQSDYETLIKMMKFEREAVSKAGLEGLEVLEGFLNNVPEFKKLRELVDLEYKVVNRIEKAQKDKRQEEVKNLKGLREWLASQIELEKKEKAGGLDIFKKWIDSQKQRLKKVLEGNIPNAQRTGLEKVLKTLIELEKEIGGDQDDWLDKFLTKLWKLKKKKSEVADEMLQKFLNEDSGKIEALETEVKNDMIRNSRHFQNLSMIFPSTFYLAVNNEISSRGYQNVIGFHNFATGIKREFVEFITKKKRIEFEAQRRGERLMRIVPFERAEENIYNGRSQLPWNFAWGLLLNIAWNIGLAFLSYHLYKRCLFPSPKEKIAGLDELDIDLKEEESDVVLSNVVLSGERAISQHLYNVLSGKNRVSRKDKGFRGKVIYNGENITAAKRKIEFAYLCHPGDLPGDIRPKDFVHFLLKGTSEKLKDKWKKINDELRLEERGKKYFSEIKDEEKGYILLEGLRSHKIGVYMIYDFAQGMPPNSVVEFIAHLQKLKKEGVSILYLTNDVFLARKIGDYISFLKRDVGRKEIAFMF